MTQRIGLGFCDASSQPIMASCRECGASLQKSAHKSITKHYGTFLVNGSMASSSWVTVSHVPCPNCGEPKPLQSLIDTWYGKLILYPLMAVAIFASFVMGLFIFILIFKVFGISEIGNNGWLILGSLVFGLCCAIFCYFILGMFGFTDYLDA
jgi:hypothetical protein